MDRIATIRAALRKADPRRNDNAAERLVALDTVERLLDGLTVRSFSRFEPGPVDGNPFEYDYKLDSDRDGSTPAWDGYGG